MDWGLVGKAAPQAINERILVGDATVASLQDFECVAIDDIECREHDQNVGVEAIDEAAAMENANAPDNYVAVADPDRVSDGDDVAFAPARARDGLRDFLEIVFTVVERWEPS